ncbi:hypothetical protein [Singulisphaera sp. PoT]|uniref:hypothetical protein n=1 Tax=Singulisphaera sp. PoT TaxID=3411797 RepID=UPI003BF61B74
MGGLHDAVRIAEQVRADVGLTAAEACGEVAFQYLAEVLLRLEHHAATQSAKGYGRYRWFWYLRRLPDEVFEGQLASTESYDRSVAEVLAMCGADPAYMLGAPSGEGTFPIDGTVIKRLAWICGFSLGYCQCQVEFRIVGKGGVLEFDRSIPGLPFRIARSRMENALERAINEFDRRNERHEVMSKLGVPVDSYVPTAHEGEPFLFQVGKVAGEPRIVTPSQIEMQYTVALRYSPAGILFHAVADLLTDPLVANLIPWPVELSSLFSLLRIATIIYGRSLIARSQLLQSGYILVERDELDALYADFREEMREHEPVLRVLPEESPDEKFSDRLLRMEGRPSPLLPGPVAFIVNDKLIGVDLYNATRRFQIMLEFPAIHGEPANVRAQAFEDAVQAVVDASPWAPPLAIRRLRGHHFKKDGKRFGEIDAFGCLDDTLLLVSCKSVIFTTQYDRGEFASITTVVFESLAP